MRKIAKKSLKCIKFDFLQDFNMKNQLDGSDR
jgi:hypothetical protein